jgi:hypothetical protein
MYHYAYNGVLSPERKISFKKQPKNTSKKGKIGQNLLFFSFLYYIIQHLKEKVKQSGQLFSKQDKIFDFYR